MTSGFGLRASFGFRCSGFGFHLLCLICYLGLPFTRAEAAEPSLPRGLAWNFHNDTGIENHPAVFFAENFESGTMKKWDHVRGSVVVTNHAPHSGAHCVEMRMIRGINEGGDAKKWFMPGKDRVHLRFYVKFSEDYQYSHHFVGLRANHITNRWSSFGIAGKKPDGTYFTTAMEPWFAWGRNPPPGEVSFYSYYIDMEIDRKMNKYWGNSFFPPGPGKGKAAGQNRVVPRLNEWHCWEFMIQANSAPDRADGKQAMWVDGKLVAEFSGIRWRSNMDVKVNCLWLQHYGYDGSDPTRQFWRDQQTVWFDDVVLATEYVGPLRKE